MNTKRLHQRTITSLIRPEMLTPRQEFHIRKPMRDALSLQTALFSVSGTAVFADFQAARSFAHDFERHRVSNGHPDPSVRTGEIVAMGVLHEVMHQMLAAHREERGADLLSRSLEHMRRELGESRVDSILTEFCAEYPPAAVYRGRTDR